VLPEEATSIHTTLVQDTDELWLSPQQFTSFSPHY
jgi:hypothetical protein